MVESPWDDTEATGNAVQAVVTSLRSWVNSNREYWPTYILRCGLAPYQFVKRGSAGRETLMVNLPLVFRPPNIH
jgi:hypothetical protein